MALATSLCLCLAALTADVTHQSLFMSALSAHPDRSLSVCWEQHCKLLPGVAGISASTVAKWTIDEVRDRDPSLFLCPSFALTAPWQEGSGKGPIRWSPIPLLTHHPSTASPSCPVGLPEHPLIGPSWGWGGGRASNPAGETGSTQGLGSKGPHLGPPAAQTVRILWGC